MSVQLASQNCGFPLKDVPGEDQMAEGVTLESGGRDVPGLAVQPVRQGAGPGCRLPPPPPRPRALRWRHGTLPLAADRATQLALEGAVFGWRTIAGQECSGLLVRWHSKAQG